jgi:hypothetical protein
MLEIEMIISEINRLISKEKSLRKKILLENALKNLKDYEKA